VKEGKEGMKLQLHAFGIPAAAHIYGQEQCQTM